VVKKTVDFRASADEQAVKSQKIVVAWDNQQEEEEIKKLALQAVVTY